MIWLNLGDLESIGDDADDSAFRHGIFGLTRESTPKGGERVEW